MIKYLRSEKGFTLLELLTVMTVMAVLLAIAVPSYKRYQIKARESALSENLYQMRHAIDAYFADQGKYPDALEDLAYGKYLRQVPVDPITRSNDSWLTDPPEANDDGELAEGGVFDVHSGSDLVGTNGIPYEEW